MSDQNRRGWKSRVLAGTMAATFAAAGLASFGATPAQAAAKSTKATQVFTSKSKGCSSIGAHNAVKADDGKGCYLGDSADGTEFRWDSGGKAAKLEVFKGSKMVGKVEFHPYSEHLWVYDTAADNDTIYVTRKGGKAIYKATDGKSGPGYKYHDYNLSGTDGKTYTYYVWDRISGGKGSGYIGSLTGVA